MGAGHGAGYSVLYEWYMIMIGLPKPILFFKGLGWELFVDRRLSICWGFELQQGLPSSFSSSVLLLRLVVQEAFTAYCPVAVGKFMEIIGNELNKVVVKSTANTSFEGGGVGVNVKVAGDNLALDVAQGALYEAP